MKFAKFNTLATVQTVTNVIIQSNIPEHIARDGIIFSAKEAPGSSGRGFTKPVKNNYLTAPLLHATQDAGDPAVLIVCGIMYIDASFVAILQGADQNIEIGAELDERNQLVFDIAYAFANTELLDPNYVPTSLNRYYFSFNIENINLENINELTGYLHKADPLTSRGTLTTVQKTSGGEGGGKN